MIRVTPCSTFITDNPPYQQGLTPNTYAVLRRLIDARILILLRSNSMMRLFLPLAVNLTTPTADP